MNSEKDLDIKRAAQLSLAEIGLGSVGHGFKIPFTGHLLSLNQLAFLLNAVNRDGLSRSNVFEISGIAAVLKSLSPAGQKLGPMLSIAMQGFLYWLGLCVFGINVFGQMVGATLLSVWAFIQPFITLFIIYGFDLIKLFEFYKEKFSDEYGFVANSIGLAIAILIFSKIIIALAMTLFSRYTKKEIKIFNESKFNDKIISQMPHSLSDRPFRAALRDLFRPIFLLSFILMLIFIWQMNGSFSEKIWLAMRPLAIAFILFYIIRSPKVAEKLLLWSKKSQTFGRIYVKAKSALDLVAQRSSQSSEVSSRRKIE